MKLTKSRVVVISAVALCVVAMSSGTANGQPPGGSDVPGGAGPVVGAEVYSTVSTNWTRDIFNLTTAHPGIFAGISYDAATNTFQVLTNSSTLGQEAVTNVASKYATTQSNGAVSLPSAINVVEVDTSYAQLTRARDVLVGKLSSGALDLPGIVHFGPNDRTGHLVIGSTSKLSAETQESLQKILGVPIDFVIAEPAEQQSRLADTRPFWGGARIIAALSCTSGFAMIRSGSSRLLTAAHCGAGAVRTWSGVAIGSVAERYYGDNQLDAELISTAADPYIYAGGVSSSTSRGVRGYQPIGSGQPGICAGGSYTGEVCGGRGDLIGQCHSFTEASGGHVYTCGEALVTNTRSMSQSGDSGGPVYIMVTGGVKAAGIVTGADHGGTNLWVSQIQSIMAKSGATVKYF